MWRVMNLAMCQWPCEKVRGWNASSPYIKPIVTTRCDTFHQQQTCEITLCGSSRTIDGRGEQSISTPLAHSHRQLPIATQQAKNRKHKNHACHWSYLFQASSFS